MTTSHRPEFGLPVNAAEMDDHTLATRLDGIVATGATTVQSGATWWYLCPTSSRCDWSSLDRLVNAAERRGLKVALQINGTPDWVHSDLRQVSPSRRHWALPRSPLERTQFTDFSRALAARYAGRVSRYEIWNEPNLPEYSYPSTSPDQYAQTLAAGYRGVKAGDPNALVVSAGLSRGDVGFASHVLDALARIPDARRSRMFFDEFGVHPYSDSESPLASSASKIHHGPHGLIDSNFNGITALTGLLDARGFTDRQLWIGEYGFSTTRTWMAAVPDARRGLYAQLAVDAVRSNRRIAGLVWYAYAPSTVTGPEWAIVGADGSPSSTYRALTAAIGGRDQLATRQAQRMAVASSTTCPGGEALSGTVNWGDDCFGVRRSDVTSFDVLVDGKVVQSASGSTPVLDSRAVPNGTHRVLVALYGRSGLLGHSTEMSLTFENHVTAGLSAGALHVSTAGSGQYRAQATLKATPAVDVSAVTVAARNERGENFDFPGHYSGATITPSGLNLDLRRSLPRGRYTLWVAYAVDGQWTDLSAKVALRVP